jgi:hypothetical protein
MTTLVDGGATDNFVDASLVAKRGLRMEEFEGFHVAVVDGYTMTCLDMILDLEVKLGNYTLTDTFYVVDLVDRSFSTEVNSFHEDYQCRRQ